MKYHITTYGCQMNVADSRRLAAELEQLGYRPTARVDKADVIVINTCVVRQQPEDRAVNRLQNLKPIKEARPEVVIALMGCLVGTRNPEATLRHRYPLADVFMPPSDARPLVQYLAERHGDRLGAEPGCGREQATDRALLLPLHDRGRLVAAHLPVVLGCSHACSYCVIPYRRGPERSRPPGEVLAEARSLAAQGVKEITLLGQIVDRYGMDLPERSSLPTLLRQLHEVDGLERIRFLTSHPNWLTDELLHAVADLPSVCEHIEVPVQSGDDDILRAMRRGYTVQQYRDLVGRIRAIVPGAAVHSDIIVGFPGETEQHFQNTYDLLAELQLDKVHIARYSPRPETLAARQMVDDVPASEKERRRQALDELQAGIVGRINQRYLGQPVQVLVEEQQKGRWRGRTRGNKLVFIEDPRDLSGQLVEVQVAWAGPWSMVGCVA
jgi:tRNA-2-methylthio-N6-dimethylallyladenosine synthase